LFELCFVLAALCVVYDLRMKWFVHPFNAIIIHSSNQILTHIENTSKSAIPSFSFFINPHLLKPIITFVIFLLYFSSIRSTTFMSPAFIRCSSPASRAVVEARFASERGEKGKVHVDASKAAGSDWRRRRWPWLASELRLVRRRSLEGERRREANVDWRHFRR